MNNGDDNPVRQSDEDIGGMAPGPTVSRVPPVLAILVAVLLFAAAATCVVPRGEFRRIEKRFPNLISHTVSADDTRESIAAIVGGELEDVPEPLPPAGIEITIGVGGMTRTAVVAGTYERSTEKTSWTARLSSAAKNISLAPIEGFIERAQIIGFVLLLGGSFGIILATGAIDVGLRWSVAALASRGWDAAVIPVCFTMFSVGGAVFGMGESTIAFVLITVPLAIRLGHDSITGVAMCYMASQVGFAGAFFNPFTIGIAQGIAELPYLSGSSLRYIVWTILTAIGIVATTRWAAMVRRDPRRSPTFELDQTYRDKFATETSLGPTAESVGERPTWRQSLVVAIAFGSVALSGHGVAHWGWYINEMAALFVVAGVLAGLLATRHLSQISDDFTDGAATMVGPCLIIALSAGIVFVLEQGLVLDTILHAVATPLERLPASASAIGIMCLQAMLNFFVPSGSGQAAMTMPLVTPLCDLVGLHRQIGVLAFQFGDGLGNLIVPTSAVLMGVLGAAKIPWTTWVRWVFPLVVALHLVAAIVLIIATKLPIAWLS